MKRPSKTKIALREPGPQRRAVSTGGLQHQAQPPALDQGDKRQQRVSKSSAPLKLILQAGREPQQIMVERQGEETIEETDARMMLTPAVTDSVVLRLFAQHALPKPIDATLTASVMAERIAAVNGGDLSSLVTILTTKAIAMDAVANEYLRRASLNMGSHLNATETYTRMALKAQAQSRANIEAIAEIKNPRPVFARQTYIAAGSQQVNNSLGPQQVNNGKRGPREEKPLLSNKVLED